MELIKHSTQLPFREIAQNAKGDVVVALGNLPKIYVFRLINQSLVKVAEFTGYPFAISVSDSGRYIAYPSASVIVLYDTHTKQSTNVTLPIYADVISVNDAGEIVAMANSSIDGQAYKIVGSVVTPISFGALTGRKQIWHGATTKVADAKRYGTPGSLATATDLIIGFYGTHTVVADGKVIGPSSTLDVGEPILESALCGRYIVVRTPTKYVSINKATMVNSTLTKTTLVPVTVPRRIAVGPTFKAHTGEQVTVTQGSGTLTIAGPAAWIEKFKTITINSTLFNVSFFGGEVTITTDILKTAITQIYFSDSEFENTTETLAYAVEVVSSKTPVSFTDYGYVSTNALAANTNPSTQSTPPVPTEYIYLNRNALMDARTLLAEQISVAITSYREQE